MAKRTATSDLNHDNWDKEEKPEEAGVFRQADDNVMQSRKIRQAKRRSTGNPYDQSNKTASPFGGFTGFKVTSSPATNFNFIPSTPKMSTDNQPEKGVSNGSSFSQINSLELKNVSSDKKSESKEEIEVTDKYKNCPKEFYADIKALNTSLSNTIKEHLEGDKCVILTPIFKDYEQHLKKIEEKYGISSIFVSEEAPTTSSFKMLGASVENNDQPKSLFGGSTSTKFNFPSLVSSKPSVETKLEGISSKDSNNLFTNPFKPTGSSLIGTSAVTSAEEKSKPVSIFTFGSGKPFASHSLSKPEVSEDSGNNDDDKNDDEPPKVELDPIVEEGATYSKRCKVFVKKGESYQDRGVGTLFLKPVPSSEKTQLIVRAENALGSVLLNTLLTAAMPVQRMGSNNVILVCLPTPGAEPPPVPVLLRVKTTEDADILLEKLKECAK